jgi:hypothetical protein
MARNRVIYQSEALYVSDEADSTAEGNHKQLQRVQSANYSFNISRQDINQYGSLARIDSIALEAPTVSFDASYYLGDGFNEEALGFANSNLNVGFASGHMTPTSGKNLFIVTADEGIDAISQTTEAGTMPVIGLGNAYLTDYTVDASVGSIPTVSVSFEAANINAVTDASGSAAGYSGIEIPSIAQADGTKLTDKVALPAATTGQGTVTALRPGDVTVSFGNAGSDAIVDITDANNGAHVQSASLSLSMSRSPLERLGSRFPFARTVDFPVNASLSVSAIVNEITAENLADTIDSSAGIDITLTFKDAGENSEVCKYQLKNARLESESFSSSIGSNKTVDLTFSTQIGGPSDADNNIFFSGTNS